MQQPKPYKYEVVDRKNKAKYDNQIFSFDNIQEFVIEIAQKHKLKITDHKNWSEGFIEDETHGLKDFKDDLEENAIYYLSHSVLDAVGFDLFQVYSTYKERIVFCAVMPDGMYDNDQILRQAGYKNGDKVLEIEVYIDNKYVGKYGSYSCGEQTAYIFLDKFRNFVTREDAAYKLELKNDPELYMRLEKAGKAKNKEYIDLHYSCWLQRFFVNIDNSDFFQYSELLESESEYMHRGIDYGIGIEDAIAAELAKLAKNISL